MITFVAMNRYKTILTLLVLLFVGKKATAQCVWSNYFTDSYEYNTVIPHIIPGMTYQNTPQTFAGCVHSGTRGLYLNIADGQIGMIYDQPFTNLCVGTNYRFSFWVKDTWGGTNNLTFRVLSATNAILSTQTVITNGIWANIVMPAFTATTSNIRFQIITNTAGGPGNDAGLDDLTLSICNPAVTNYSTTQCNSVGNLNLFTQITNPQLSQNGTWTGPSALQNGFNGTFSTATNIAGTYTYTIDGGANCPDSIATVQVQLVTTPIITPLGPITACNSYTLPAITGTGLSGNQHYYTGPNGTGMIIANGSTITTSQTIYMFDGNAGCSDNESVVITISPNVNAGNNNSASYCGAGPIVNLTDFLSANATSGGTWSESTIPVSGAFNPLTTQFNTSSLAPGNYTFQYSVTGTPCPNDVSDFTIIIGNTPNVDLGNDTSLCSGQTLTLNAGVYDDYLWNNNSTNPTLTVTQPGGTYWVTAQTLGANQIVNGDFELGNNGFTTQYVIGAGGPWGQLSNPGTYAISTSPNLVHNNFGACNDHTTNPGVNQMVVNGSDVPNTEVWCQTIPVQPNTTYEFGTWATSVFNCAPNEVAVLQFSINTIQLGSVFSPSNQDCNWSQFTENWFSGLTTSAEVCIVNQNTLGSGNDFALDDITFRPVCISKDTVVVIYAPAPIVDLGVDQFHCAGSTVTLNAQNAGDSYLWNTTETTQTIDVTSSGNYSVTVTNAQNCSATDQVTITFETPLNAGNDNSIIICSTANQTDLATLIDANAQLGGTWESNSPNFTGNLSANGVVDLNGQAGMFDFLYIADGTFCPNDTAVINLTIHEQPVAAPNQALHFCNTLGDNVDFSPYLNHPVITLPGNWLTPANLPGGSFNLATNVLDLSGLPNDQYIFQYNLPAEQGCIDAIMEIIVDITAVPFIDFTSDITEGCQPLSVLFTNESTAQGNVVYTWDFGDGTGSSSSTTVSNTYEAAGCYDITLSAVADGLCVASQTTTDMICVHPVPLASFTFSPQQIFVNEPTIQLTNNSINNETNSWNFGDGTTSTLEAPDHTFPQDVVSNYLIELIVSTQFGCTDTARQIVVIKDQILYYVPNSFTPDGDEFNNIFIPILTSGIDFSDYELKIYDRWGEILFESYDVNVGWDGTYHGKLAPQGTYTWTLQFGLIENDKDLFLTGHVTLTR
ncbi:MAG: PKD domain-containing protein [Fluviicola sp.]|nr:PKD domain-containing protein [Fluviicola sp.]